MAKEAPPTLPELTAEKDTDPEDEDVEKPQPAPPARRTVVRSAAAGNVDAYAYCHVTTLILIIITTHIIVTIIMIVMNIIAILFIVVASSPRFGVRMSLEGVGHQPGSERNEAPGKRPQTAHLRSSEALLQNLPGLAYSSFQSYLSPHHQINTEV